MKVSGKTIHVRANNRDIYDKLCNWNSLAFLMIQWMLAI